MNRAGEFDRLADRTLNEMVEALADSEDEGIDADLESGVLSIQFEDGTKYVVREKVDDLLAKIVSFNRRIFAEKTRTE